MSITNGYATLSQIKARLGLGESIVSTGISFASSTKIIADTNKSLGPFATGDRITVAGSTSNDGTYTVASGGVAAQLTVTEALTTEAAGATVRVSKVSEVIDDEKLENMIEAISRAIDNLCGRRFYLDGADATRYFTAQDADALFPGDLKSVTTLLTDENGDRTYEFTWTTGDYDLEPYNAALDSKPYTKISVTPQGDYGFPRGVKKGVKIVGKWGWPAVPDAVTEGCLLAAQKLFKRKDAIFGVVSGGEMGQLKQMMRDDPELALLLNPYIEYGLVGI